MGNTLSEYTTLPNAKVEKIKSYIENLYYSGKAEESPHVLKACRILGFIEDTSKLSTIGEEFAKSQGFIARQVFFQQVSKWDLFSRFMNFLENKKRLSESKAVSFFESVSGKTWSQTVKKRVASIVENWGTYIKILERQGNDFVWIASIRGIKKDFLKSNIVQADKWCYDLLTRKDNLAKKSSSSLKKELSDLYSRLQHLDEIKDDEKKGDIFESILCELIEYFGFQPRKEDGPREGDRLTYKRRKGGGDVAFFFHYHFELSHGKGFKGIILGAEAKATSRYVPKRALDQVRTFSRKLREKFPEYRVYSLVFSRAFSFEPLHAKGKESPEIINVPVDAIVKLAHEQYKRWEKGKKLITPFDFAVVFENLLENSIYEPTDEIIVQKFAQVIG